MTRPLAKICSLIPFAVYGLLVLLTFLEETFFAWNILFIKLIGLVIYFGWIPSLAGAVAGVVLSLLSLKERHGKLFLICSCVNVAIGVAWGVWGIRAMMPYEPI